jgi:hypothetical protein
MLEQFVGGGDPTQLLSSLATLAWHVKLGVHGSQLLFLHTSPEIAQFS